MSLLPGQQVAANVQYTKRQKSWIVAVVTAVGPGDDMYTVKDLFPDRRRIDTFVVTSSDLRPFPGDLSRPLSPGDRVLSLWLEEGEWSSMFYEAVVVQFQDEQNLKLRYSGQDDRLFVVDRTKMVLHAPPATVDSFVSSSAHHTTTPADPPPFPSASDFVVQTPPSTPPASSNQPTQPTQPTSALKTSKATRRSPPEETNQTGGGGGGGTVKKPRLRTASIASTSAVLSPSAAPLAQLDSQQLSAASASAAALDSETKTLQMQQQRVVVEFDYGSICEKKKLKTAAFLCQRRDSSRLPRPSVH